MLSNDTIGNDQRTDVGSSSPIGLRRRSLILMIILTIVTFGFYYPIWFLRRRRALNSLNSPRKLATWPFVLFLGMFLIQVIVAFVSAPASPEEAIGAGWGALLDLAQLAVGILLLVQCFFIKDILEDHLTGPDANTPGSLLGSGSEVKLSGLLTFFSTIFYLQHVINRDILTRQPTSV